MMSSFEEFVEIARGLRRRQEVPWEHVAGADAAKTAVAAMIALSLARPPRDDVTLHPPRRILFYGPPGTGKTLLAAAASCRIRKVGGEPASFFAVKVSDLVSRHFGETARIVSALYDEARRDYPSVIFLDEIEAIARRRDVDGGGGAEERRILSTLLSELDGLQDKGETVLPPVVTIAATNRPWDLDRAMIMRFRKKAFVGLPDDVTRRRIIEIHLAKSGYRSSLREEDWMEILDASDSYSGRELETVVHDAILEMLVEQNPEMPQLAISRPELLARTRLTDRPLLPDDLLKQLRAGEPQTSREEQQAYEEWAAAPESLSTGY